MATLAFQPYVDKENAGSTGVRPNKGSSGGIPGKAFNKGNDFAGPRRALGDVGNKACSMGSGLKPMQKPSIPLQNKGLQMKSTNIQPLASRSGNIMQKPTVNESVKKKIQMQPKLMVKKEPVTHKKLPEIEDIEHMYIPSEGEDDFEDIWPKADRISTYIKKIVSWRPPCIFGDFPDSEEEEDEDTKQKKSLDELDAILEASVAKYSTEKSDTHLDELPDIELVPEEFEDVPLPCLLLDNTLDLMPNIGTLEMKE